MRAGSELRPATTATRHVAITIVAAIVAVGALASAVLWRTAERRSDHAERAALGRVVDRLDTEMRVIDAALTAAPALVLGGAEPLGDPFGDTARRAFERFATEIVEHTTLRAVAFEPVVTDDLRAAFEQQAGVAIRDRAGDGWAVAPVRTSYAPVLWVVPRTDDTTPIIGFDLAAEPVRGAALRAAERSDDVEVTQPLVSRPTGTTSVFVARALSIDGTTVGWVSSAVTSEVFEAALDQVVPGGATVTVADDGILLFGDERPAGASVTVPVGTRTWRVWVEGPPAQHTAAITTAAVTALLVATAALALRRRRRRSIAQARAEDLERAVVRRRTERAAALSRLGQQLSVARDLDDVVLAVTAHGPTASGFEVVGLATLLDGDRHVRLHGQRGTAAAGRPPLDVEVPRPAPVLERLRHGEELSFDDPSDIDRSGILRSIVGDEVGALDLVPLRDSTRRFIGVVGFASSSRPPQPEAGYLRSIADLVAQTIERTHLFEQQAQVVLELQQHTLRPIPPIDGTCIAARYLPAARALGVGGDWYGVEQVSDRETALVVGDVVGHGITAVVDMVEISGLIAAMARSDGDLSSLPVNAAALFERPRQPLVRMATAVVCRVDVVDRRLEYVRMGHPPAVLLTPDGSAQLLDGAGHPPIGVATPQGRADRVRFEPGSVLVLYTDGLVERRGEVIDVGLQRLLRAVEGVAHCTPDEIADALVARCADEHAPDDIALLVARLG